MSAASRVCLFTHMCALCALTSKQILCVLAGELEYKNCDEPPLRQTLIGAPHDAIRGRPSICLGAKLLSVSHRRSVLRSQREQ